MKTKFTMQYNIYSTSTMLNTIYTQNAKAHPDYALFSLFLLLPIMLFSCKSPIMLKHLPIMFKT